MSPSCISKQPIHVHSYRRATVSLKFRKSGWCFPRFQPQFRNQGGESGELIYPLHIQFRITYHDHKGLQLGEAFLYLLSLLDVVCVRPVRAKLEKRFVRIDIQNSNRERGALSCEKSSAVGVQLCAPATRLGAMNSTRRGAPRRAAACRAARRACAR